MKEKGALKAPFFIYAAPGPFAGKNNFVYWLIF